MGITGFIARAYGANDHSEISLTLLRFLMLGILAGVIVIILSNPIIRLALGILESSDQIESLASQYSKIRIWSAPATLCIYVFTGFFVGLHKTQLALVLQLILNGTNIFLDLLFVPVLDFGVAGVAWATLIAEYTAALAGIFFVKKTSI